MSDAKVGVVEAVQAAVVEHEVVGLLQELVRIPTENPPGNEERIVDLLAARMGYLGMAVERHDSPSGRPNLLGRLGTGGPRLVWCGHMDVVPAGAGSLWPHPPFDGNLQDGRVWGRGACDMKAGIAACLEAIAALRRGGCSLRGTLEVHLVSDEETMGAHGAEHLARLGFTKADGCIVGEPTSLRMAVAERGAVWLRVTCLGAAAHGSMPERGASAIEAMADLIGRLDATRPATVHPHLGRATINVGVVTGGTKINTVADLCEIQIDRRTLPREQAEVIRDSISAVAEDVARRRPQIAFRVEMITEAAPFEADVQSEIAVALERSAMNVTGRAVDIFGLSGFTDGRFYGADGTPTIIYGPGDTSEAHTSHESVRVDELVTATRVYAGAFLGFLGLGT